MTNKAKSKRTIEQMIADAEAKLNALKEKQKEAAKKQQLKATKLTKETAGMKDLLSLINTIAKKNDVKAADVVTAASRLLRTGLIIKHKSQSKFDDEMAM